MKINNCPSCKSNDVFLHTNHNNLNGETESRHVICNNCKLQGPKKWYEEYAIKLWNNLLSIKELNKYK
jgi:DNA-directed RNA polymerase subunit M/transcription elongation factor TFIIS